MLRDEVTNALGVLDLATGAVHMPRITGPAPMPCLSAEMFTYGSLAVIFGGWTRGRLEAAIVPLDLCPDRGAVAREPAAEPRVVKQPDGHADLLGLFLQQFFQQG